MLHVLRPLWKAFYASQLKKNMKKHHAPSWPSFVHAYLPGRRRESAIGTQEVAQERLRGLGLDSIAISRDMRNAFACTTNAKRTAVTESIIPDAETKDDMGNV